MEALVQTEDFLLLRKKTGEIIPDVVLSFKKKVGVGDMFMKLYLNFLEALASYRLRGETLRVLFNLVRKAKRDNRVPSAKVIAELMGLQYTHVCADYQILLKHEILIKKEGIYYLSPAFCWKGSQETREIAFQELFLENKPGQIGNIKYDKPKSLISEQNENG